MEINRKERKIVAHQWERNQVMNYFCHCVMPNEKDGWQVIFLDKNIDKNDYLCKQ